MCRNLLEQAVKDRLVIDLKSPQWCSAGDLTGMANLLSEYLRSESAENRELRAEVERLKNHLTQHCNQCERCGGTGQQESGLYNPDTKQYDDIAGICRACNGVGFLGIKEILDLS
jgi:hypothetical protein